MKINDFNPTKNPKHNRIMVQLVLHYITDGDYSMLLDDIENPDPADFRPWYWNWILEPLRELGVRTAKDVDEFCEAVADEYGDSFDEFNLTWVRGSKTYYNGPSNKSI